MRIRFTLLLISFSIVIAGSSESWGLHPGELTCLGQPGEPPCEDPSTAPAVGFMLYEEGGTLTGCGGTLIARNKFLTAAHCLGITNCTGVPVEIDFRQPEHVWVFFQHAGFVSVESLTDSTGWCTNRPAVPLWDPDLAILTFPEEEAIRHIAPARVNTAGSCIPPLEDTTVDAVAWGNPRHGLKQKQIGRLTWPCPLEDEYTPVWDKVCANIGSREGDSGSPMIANADPLVLGVTHGVGEVKYWTDVCKRETWIESNAGEDLNDTYRRAPQVPVDEEFVWSKNGSVSGDAEETFSFDNPDVESVTLYITLNAEVGEELDLYVRQGSLPPDPYEPINNDCNEERPGPFEACEISGTGLNQSSWQGLVKNRGAAGVEFQVTATAVSLPACDDGIDNDGDGFCDMPTSTCTEPGVTPGDSGCNDLDDASEERDCKDGLDNDHDGSTDFSGGDPGCGMAIWPTEAPECDDGLDNDGDGRCDVSDSTCIEPYVLPGDSGCTAPSRIVEGSPPSSGCGLLGIEAVALMAGLMVARNRRRKR